MTNSPRNDGPWDTEAEQWSQHIQQAEAEGQSVWTINVFTPEDVDPLLMAALAGDDEAARWLPMIGRMMRQVQSVKRPNRKKSPLCLLCDTIFWCRQIPRAFVFLVPRCDDPTLATASGICRKCRDGRTLRELQVAAMDVYRKQLLTENFRELQIHETSGHA